MFFSCLGGVGADDDRASEQRTKTQYCMSWSPAGCVKKQEMLLVLVSCVGDVGADDDRPSEQRSKTRYCMGWTISVCKQEMLAARFAFWGLGVRMNASRN